MTQSVSVDAQCGPCNGSSVFRGMAEPKGVGVVCLECKGSGNKKLTYIPFTQRTRRTDVQTVRKSAGMFIGTGFGPTGGTISYDQFLTGKRPD